MTRNEKNIVERWALMASKDLGCERNVEAYAYAELFRKIFEDGETQISGEGMKWIKPTIRGFAINNEGYYERCSVTDCLDLDFIEMDKEAAKDLDWELMNRKGWFGRYQYAQTI